MEKRSQLKEQIRSRGDGKRSLARTHLLEATVGLVLAGLIAFSASPDGVTLVLLVVAIATLAAFAVRDLVRLSRTR